MMTFGVGAILVLAGVVVLAEIFDANDGDVSWHENFMFS